jgi:Big-like domain-containing protein
VVNADQTISYTPNPNVNGADSITYTVTLNGTLTSNPAGIAITITPVNDIPVAVADTTGAVVSKLNQVNMIANDTDPDGNTDIVNAVIVAWPPQLGAQPVPANGGVTYTPTSTGTFTFSYQAVDKAGALSNVAAVTVTVSGSEAIQIQKAIYKQGTFGGANSARWTVQGVDSIREGETLSVVYNNGTLNAANGGGSCNGTATNLKCVIGTAVVDSLGNYLLDYVLNPGGNLDPTDTNTWSSKPTQIKVFSSSPVLGGSNTSGISLK